MHVDNVINILKEVNLFDQIWWFLNVRNEFLFIFIEF